MFHNSNLLEPYFECLKLLDVPGLADHKKPRESIVDGRQLFMFHCPHAYITAL
jgi:hypothetical protein